MGQLTDIINQFEKMGGIQRVINIAKGGENKEHTPESVAEIESLDEEIVDEEIQSLNENHQFKNIKRLIKKTNR